MSGDVSSAELRERMVSGQLPREKLQLADALGYSTAQAALQRPDPEPTGPWDPGEPIPSLENWGRRLGRFGPAAMMRIAIAVARHVASTVDEVPALATGLMAADAFLGRSSGSGTAQDLAATCEAASKEVARATLSLEQSAPAQAQACLTLLPVLRAISTILEGGPTDRALLDGHYLRTLEQASTAALPLEEVQAAVRDEVCAWALA
tara:strand:+ start:91 stop:711 length:621 start_codon:yes stop_codon:yes gene_type:complete